MGEVEMKLVLVGHIELDEGSELTEKKVETEEPDDGAQGEIPPKRRVTQSIAALRDTKRKENIMKQELRWIELTKGRKSSTASASLGAPIETVTTSSVMSTVSSVSTEGMTTATISSTTEGEMVDLEAAMMSQDDDDDDTYGKKYKTTSEDRTDRNVGRVRQKEEREKQEKELAAMKYAEQQLQKERQKQKTEQALLEEDERVVEERRRISEEKQKAWLERKATELEKQRQHEKERKEKHKRKRKERMDEEQEEQEMVDDMDKDKDYNPEEDPEADFVVEDQDIEDEDTFEVEKHMHAVNFDEAGDYLVSVNRYMEAFTKIVQRGKDDVAREYKKLIKFVKLMVEKLGTYSPMEAADTDAVFDTIVDPRCIAWRRAQHGTKTRNSIEILRVEEKRWKVEKSIEECEISPEEQVKTFAEMMQVKSKTDRAEVVRMVKHYFGHVAKAHEEVASAVRIAQSLIDEIDENSWLQVVSNGTRPLIMMQVHEMLQQAANMKSEREQQQKVEQLRGLPIEDIIKERNMPRPVE